LSKGQKTQLALVAAICPEPDLLILDEPTSGLDPIVRREFIQTVIGAYQSGGDTPRTIFVSTHLISEFEGLIDEFTIIEQGRELLAPWLLALLLATTALWWRPGTDENAASVLWLACLSLGLVLLAVAAFGKEFSHGTIHALLGQPISRSRLWLEKAAALALAM